MNYLQEMKAALDYYEHAIVPLLHDGQFGRAIAKLDNVYFLLTYNIQHTQRPTLKISIASACVELRLLRNYCEEENRGGISSALQHTDTRINLLATSLDSLLAKENCPANFSMPIQND